MEALTPDEIQSLLDELARARIRDALLRYCRGVDRADEELIISCFHADAIETHGKFHGSAVSFAKSTCDAVSSGTTGIQHTLGNMIVEFESATVARVETFVNVTYREVARPDYIAAFGGRYLDRFELRGDDWKVARRTLVNDWSWRERLAEDTVGVEGCLRGAYRESDPLYSRSIWAPTGL